jgi:hypothetical protein
MFVAVNLEGFVCKIVTANDDGIIKYVKLKT